MRSVLTLDLLLMTLYTGTVSGWRTLTRALRLKFTEIAGGVGKLNLHVFIFQDAQLNIAGGKFDSIVVLVIIKAIGIV